MEGGSCCMRRCPGRGRWLSGRCADQGPIAARNDSAHVCVLYLVLLMFCAACGAPPPPPSLFFAIAFSGDLFLNRPFFVSEYSAPPSRSFRAAPA